MPRVTAHRGASPYSFRGRETDAWSPPPCFTWRCAPLIITCAPRIPIAKSWDIRPVSILNTSKSIEDSSCQGLDYSTAVLYRVQHTREVTVPLFDKKSMCNQVDRLCVCVSTVPLNHEPPDDLQQPVRSNSPFIHPSRRKRLFRG